MHFFIVFRYVFNGGWTRKLLLMYVTSKDDVLIISATHNAHDKDAYDKHVHFLPLTYPVASSRPFA